MINMRGKPAAWAYREVAIKLWDMAGSHGMGIKEIGEKVDDMAYRVEIEKRAYDEETTQQFGFMVLNLPPEEHHD